MPYLNRIGGGSARKFGLSKGSFKCLTHSTIVTLAPDNKCYYPANYAATATNYSCQQGPACYSGGGVWGSDPSTWNPPQCCSCAQSNCYGLSCQCYDANWNPIGNSSGGCYAPYYITTTCTSYSCPINSTAVTLSGTTCVYPPAYNATLL